ncbi:type II CRISPR RNA-guided endonuclease Cas9 [Campylobacter jejuni]|nr:type II CRISPR RNA-guided endonuclease Cas9 [Campylobacter jejuni]
MKIIGFNLGIANIGWALRENDKIIDCGVRVFDIPENPKNGNSLALERRENKARMKIVKRKKARMLATKTFLKKELNVDLSKLFLIGSTQSIYELRAKALSSLISKEELSAIILHIAKHRGYDDSALKNENGTIIEALNKNKEAMLKFKSVGEYFYKNFVQNKEVKKIRNTTEDYSNSVPRSLLKQELDLILDKQKELGLIKNADFKEKLFEIIFFKRPLKDFSNKIGNCIFFENEKRAAKNTISACEFVALGKVVNLLKSIEKDIGIVYEKDSINEIMSIILDKTSISYKKIRDILNLPQEINFKGLDYSKNNIENSKLVDLKKLNEFKKALGDGFANLDKDILDSIATDITLTKDTATLKEKLKNYNVLNAEQIEKLSELVFNDHINLSLKALKQIIPLMYEGKRYDEACELCNFTIAKNQEKSEYLPLFEKTRFAKDISSPVVIRAICEFRKLLNDIIRRYGSVHKIHLELTRDFGISFSDRKKIIKEIEQNEQSRIKALETIKELKLEETSKNIQIVRLFEDQKGICPYSGLKMDLNRLDELVIDYIRPYNRSLDDSYSNKVLTFKKLSDLKQGKTPFEAFGEDEKLWAEINERIKEYNGKKRFKIFDKFFKDKKPFDFTEQTLQDTRWLTKLVASYLNEYLSFLPISEDENTALGYGEKGSKQHVILSSGMITQMLRNFWYLGFKNHKDYKNNAMDAIIVAFTTNSIIFAFNNFKKELDLAKAEFYANKISESDYLLKRKFLPPFSGFKEQALEKVKNIFVSHSLKIKNKGTLHDLTPLKIKELKNTYGDLDLAVKLGKIRKYNDKYYANANGSLVRADLFVDKKNKFHAVSIYKADFSTKKLPNKTPATTSNGETKEGIEMNENYNFCMSLYKNTPISVKIKGMKEPIICYYHGFNTSGSKITYKKHDNNYHNLSEDEMVVFRKNDKESIAVGKILEIKKYSISPSGELSLIENEERKWF